MNPNWTEKEKPSAVFEMQQLIEMTLKKYNYSFSSGDGWISGEQLACEIAASLNEAGYGKLDPFVLSFIDQFRHGLKDLGANLKAIREKTELLSLSEEKCVTTLKLIEHAKERLSGAAR